MSEILIAGVGNVLRRDDGFGVEVAKRLAHRFAPPRANNGRVKVIEVGISGIHLAQELMAGYDLLVVVDAVERGGTPGTLHILEVAVPDLAEWPEIDRQDFLADMHDATPSKALILAKALGCLPPSVFIVGCQPADVRDLGIGLSAPVERAATRTIEEIEALVRRFQRPAAGAGVDGAAARDG